MSGTMPTGTLTSQQRALHCLDRMQAELRRLSAAIREATEDGQSVTPWDARRWAARIDREIEKDLNEAKSRS